MVGISGCITCCPELLPVLRMHARALPVLRAHDIRDEQYCLREH